MPRHKIVIIRFIDGGGIQRRRRGSKGSPTRNIGRGLQCRGQQGGRRRCQSRNGGRCGRLGGTDTVSQGTGWAIGGMLKLNQVAGGLGSLTSREVVALGAAEPAFKCSDKVEVLWEG
jgi:hypothetical protein